MNIAYGPFPVFPLPPSLFICISAFSLAIYPSILLYIRPSAYPRSVNSRAGLGGGWEKECFKNLINNIYIV
jgi:hypothetical protein